MGHFGTAKVAPTHAGPNTATRVGADHAIHSTLTRCSTMIGSCISGSFAFLDLSPHASTNRPLFYHWKKNIEQTCLQLEERGIPIGEQAKSDISMFRSGYGTSTFGSNLNAVSPPYAGFSPKPNRSVSPSS